jgi:hypothetical protein
MALLYYEIIPSKLNFSLTLSVISFSLQCTGDDVGRAGGTLLKTSYFPHKPSHAVEPLLTETCSMHVLF